MPKLLLDPGILDLPDRDPGAVTQFWVELSGWVEDGRVVVGPMLLAEKGEALVKATADKRYCFPPHTDQDRIKMVSKLLSRCACRVEVADAGEVRMCVPAYTYGNGGECWKILASDLRTCSIAEAFDGLATARAHWDDHGPAQSVNTVNSVNCFDPPPLDFERCFSPHALLASDDKDFLKVYFAGRRINIVGGQPDATIIQGLRERLGVDSESIRWEPAEKNKPPRLNAWKSLIPGRDIAICITGKIGHSSSIKAAKRADQRGVEMLKVENAGLIGEVLRQLAFRGRDS